MAARKPRLARGVLAANVLVHDGPDGPTWYGPSYPENGEPPAEVADKLPPHVWDAQKVWPTRDDAEAVGLAWEPPEPAADPVQVEKGGA